MAKMKLTKRSVERLPAPDPSGKQVVRWDDDLPGFGVLVSGTTNVKTYIVQHRIAGLGGKYRRVTIARVDVLDLDEARGRARQTMAEMFAGRDPKRSRRTPPGTLRSTLAAYLAARSNLSQRSREGYPAAIEGYLSDWLDKAIGDVTADMVEDRHAQIKGEVERRRRTHQANGNATANGVFRAFRALWNFAAERDDTLGRNPVARLHKQWYPVPRRVRMVPADRLADWHRAVDALENEVARDYLLLLLFTGMRRGETAALRWDDVDFKLGVVRQPAKRTKAGRKLDLPMTDFVRGLLVARQAIGRDASGFVFPAYSKSKHIEEPKFPLGLVADATGIRVTAHDLRRTYVTVAESTDIAPLALKALVNHAVPAVSGCASVGLFAEPKGRPRSSIAAVSRPRGPGHDARSISGSPPSGRRSRGSPSGRATSWSASPSSK
jgi:integrase